MDNAQLLDNRQAPLNRAHSGTTTMPTASHAIPRRDPSNPVPLSFAQERMWFLDQLAPGSPFYAETAGVHVAASVDVDILERAVNAVVQRHEILRTRFETRPDGPVQVVAPSLHIPVMF